MSVVYYTVCIEGDWSTAANNTLPDLIYGFTMTNQQAYHINRRFGILGAVHSPPFHDFNLPHGLDWFHFPLAQPPRIIISAMALSFPDPHFNDNAGTGNSNDDDNDDNNDAGNGTGANGNNDNMVDFATPFATPPVNTIGVLMIFQASPMRRSCYDFVDCSRNGSEGVSLGDVVGAVEACVRRVWEEKVWGIFLLVW